MVALHKFLCSPGTPHGDFLSFQGNGSGLLYCCTGYCQFVLWLWLWSWGWADICLQHFCLSVISQHLWMREEKRLLQLLRMLNILEMSKPACSSWCLTWMCPRSCSVLPHFFPRVLVRGLPQGWIVMTCYKRGSMDKCLRQWSLPVFWNASPKWVQNPDRLAKYFEKLFCQPGNSKETQIKGMCWDLAQN